MENKIRYPKIGGVKDDQNALKELLNKKPSEELIRIINENNKLIVQEDLEESQNQDHAARSPEAGI